MSETDRWASLAKKSGAFYTALDEYLGRCLSECACPVMVLAEGYQIVALNTPREVISLAKRREKAGKAVTIKPAAQLKADARECIEHVMVLCSWISEDLRGADLAVKGAVDIKRIAHVQFLYKQLLRVALHFSHAHPNAGGGGVPKPMLRNLAKTLLDKQNGALLGVIVNELDFLKALVGCDDVNQLSPLSSPRSPPRSPSPTSFSQQQQQQQQQQSQSQQGTADVAVGRTSSGSPSMLRLEKVTDKAGGSAGGGGSGPVHRAGSVVRLPVIFKRDDKRDSTEPSMLRKAISTSQCERGEMGVDPLSSADRVAALPRLSAGGSVAAGSVTASASDSPGASPLGSPRTLVCCWGVLRATLPLNILARRPSS